jgi:DNA-binding NtrC family response regulator
MMCCVRKDIQLIGGSNAIAGVRSMVERVAGVDSGVLLVGESGTGAELLAEEIHALGPRREHPFVRIECATCTDDVAVDDLLGTDSTPGVIEQTSRGTVFLREISALPLPAQARVVRRLRDSQSPAASPRYIASAGGPLDAAVRAGRFRSDLYYRIAVVVVMLPPLRERPEDLPLLANRILEETSRRLSKQFDGIERDAMDCLRSYPWRGNLTELAAALERAAVIERSPTLTRGSLPPEVATYATGSRGS